MGDISSESAVDFRTALDEFEVAWENPKHTRFILPAVEVNSVLARKYTTSTPIKITRDMVWDMELQKAWDPTTFIPYVVSEGKSWGRRNFHDGSEHFFRSSEQLGWIATGRGTVLEEVFVDHAGQRILFLGRESMRDDSRILKASDFQPLFHVEHAAAGSIEEPLNLWRIVILTEQHDERYTEPFKEMARQGLLPGFLEIYIERRFHCDLKSERPDRWRTGSSSSADCEQLFRAQEANKRMKDNPAHACHALCCARVVEEVRLRKGTPAAEHLKLVLNVNNDRCDGGVFGVDTIIDRPRETSVSQADQSH